MGQVQAGRLDQAALGAQPLKEENELELEEHHGVDRRPAALGVAVPGPLADEREVQYGVEVPVEVVRRHQAFERDSDGLVERAELRWTKHDRPSERGPRSTGGAGGGGRVPAEAAQDLLYSLLCGPTSQRPFSTGCTVYTIQRTAQRSEARTTARCPVAPPPRIAAARSACPHGTRRQWRSPARRR